MTGRRRVGAGLAAAPVALGLLLAVEALAALRGRGRPFLHASSAPLACGCGPPLVYAVLGDSTGAGQGATYERGIALATARHLGRSHGVRLTNLSVSGATTTEVLRHQAGPAARLRADIVLVAVGANDVTHLTSARRLRAALVALVDRLQSARHGTQIVLTGAPAMGAVPRFAQPLRWVAGLRTRRVNRVFRAVARERGLIFAPVARETAGRFRRDPALFSADRYHPNARGYGTWVPVLTRALDEALARRQPGAR